EGKCAARQRMLAVLVQRDDLNRDMTRQWIVLELTQDRPTQHVRQEDVERNRCRRVLLGQFQRLRATRGDQHLEAFVARKVNQNARVVRVVLDDQEDG